MRRLEHECDPVVLVDARSERTYNESGQAPEGSVRLDPNRAFEQATAHRLPRDAWLATLCA